MAEEVIGLLFGVEGVGVNGASGQEIVKGLTQIVNEINSGKSTVPKIKFHFDTTEATKAVDDLKAKLKDIEKIASIKVAQSSGKQSGQTRNTTQDLQKQVEKYRELSAAIKKWVQDSKTAAKLSEEYSGLSRNLDGSISGTGKAEQYDKTVQSINATVEALKELKFAFADADDASQGLKRGDVIRPNEKDFKRIASEIGITEEQYRQLFEQMQTGATKAQQNVQNAHRTSQNAWDKQVRNVSQQIDQMYDTISKNPELKKTADDLRKYMQSGSGDVGDLKNRFDDFTRAVAKSGDGLETWGDQFKKTFAGKVRSALAAAITGAFTKYLREIYQNVVNIDKALVNLQIASGKTRTETKALLKEYAALAKQLGATTIEVAEAADTWLRQGYSAEEANTLIANSMMLSKLGQMESAEASTALTSAMKGYSVAVEDSVKIVDKLTKVDMEAAASAGDIATAMAETATSAKLSGVSMDTLIGYLTVIKEVTQDSSESVGVFAKTLFARMNNVAAGKFVDDETGESLNDVETVLHELGIELRGANDEFRNSSDVLSDVAERWDEFNDTERNAIATAMAGARNFEKFNVLMENYGTAMKYAEISTESAGTAIEKFSDYTSGIKAAFNSLQTSFEELSMTLLDSELIVGFANFLAGVVEFLNMIASVADGMLVTIPAITLALVALHAILLQIKTTQTFTSMVAGLKGVLAIFPAILAKANAWLLSLKAQALAHKGSVTAIAAQTAATKAATVAQTAMNATNPVGWIMLAITAIYALVKAINTYANAAQTLSDKQKEVAAASQEKAQKTKEEQEALDNLIAKYQELRSQETVSADSRKEIRDVQKQINLLLGDEARQWDAVNGGVEENLQALKEMRAAKAAESLDDYASAYYDAQTSSNLAYESNREGAGWAEWAADWGGWDVVVDEWDKQGAGIIDKLQGVVAEWDTNFTNQLTVVKFTADGAEEYLARIREAKKALEDDQSYNHFQSDLYKQLGVLEQKYASFGATVDATKTRLIESVVTWAGAAQEANGAVIESVDDYNEFKQSVINAAISSDHLADSISSQSIAVEDVNEAVEAYMAANYGKLYDQLTASSKGATVTLKSACQILDEVQEGYDGITSALENVTDEGYLTAEGLSTLLKLEKENALGGLELSSILEEDANGYKLAGNALEQYIQALIKAYEAQYAMTTAFASQEDKENAINNLKTLKAVLATLTQTQTDSTDAIKKQREELKKQKKAYDDQLDAYKELIDLRKELLEAYEEELSYQKELEKRQRNVVSLQTKLSVARLDQSAAGQARVRELEAELKEAQEDLDDFTLEHAIDVLTDQLDSQYAEYEAFIKSKLDAIENILGGLDTTPEVNVNVDTSWMSTALSDIDDALITLEGKIVSGNQKQTDPTPTYTRVESVGEENSSPWKDYTDAARDGCTVMTSYEFYRNDNNVKKYGSYGNYLAYQYVSFKDQGGIKVYHSGGLVGSDTEINSNEEFAKLLKGEFVSTPAQMKRFMEETLPRIANYTATGGTNEFNAPLIEILCENVTSESLPELKRIVEEAVKELQKQLDSGMSRTGFKRTPTKRLT